jgi:hypothetical protein
VGHQDGSDMAEKSAEKSAERIAFILSWLKDTENADEPADHIRNQDKPECQEKEKEVKLNGQIR